MPEVDLWADDDSALEAALAEFVEEAIIEAETGDQPTGLFAVLAPEFEAPAPGKTRVFIESPETDDPGERTRRSSINIITESDLSQGDFANCFRNEVISRADGFTHYRMPLTAPNAFVLRHSFGAIKDGLILEGDAAAVLRDQANIVPRPVAVKDEDGRHINLTVPGVPQYRKLVSTLNGYPIRDGSYRIDVSRVMDLAALNAAMPGALPKIAIADEVVNLFQEPIPGFDGTVDSLKSIPVSVLHVVTANTQSWKSLAASKKTLAEKMESFGITTLYDLLFWLPRRYIDKSAPQDFGDLIEGETATVIGAVVESVEISAGRGGAAFVIETPTGQRIRATFFNQRWLRNKFKIGDDVLITGKFGWWNGTPQISGVSIENSDEAELLPIVPVYNQSASKGITTYLILSANRELLARLGKINLPDYLVDDEDMPYERALSELHFPSSLVEHKKALDSLALHELIQVQVLVQSERDATQKSAAVVSTEGERALQAKGIAALPFALTLSQKQALVLLNQKMASSVPSATLLNADVGSGKTVTAQMACLRAVDAGHQAVILGPTEILARQLFEGTKSLADRLGADSGEKVNVVFLSATMKAAEKKAVKELITSGEADIIVGTHSLVNESVAYADLALVVVDEQQKFGAAQRSALLSSRSDGLTPAIIMMSATPIPRSTAQVMYGDIDMVELKDKPPGRLPITTQWLQEDPTGFISEMTNQVWSDVISEAQNGNQTFVIAPLVSESDKIDSASVERTYETLKDVALSSLRVGVVHGQMKQDAQRETMEKFRNKEFDVLVSSTVVEVGVDIKDATRVIILSADRLGASSLHQIRGRVGRNSKPSTCYLISMGKTNSAQARLQSLVDSENGFDIATADLAARGEGKLFSSEQSGQSDLMFADVFNHASRIEEAKAEARRILSSPHADTAVEDSRKRFNSTGRMV